MAAFKTGVKGFSGFLCASFNKLMLFGVRYQFYSTLLVCLWSGAKIHDFQLAEAFRRARNPHYNAQAIGEVGVARKVAARFFIRRGTDTPDIANPGQRLRIKQILKEKLAGFINIGINFMRGDGFRRKPHADVTANLAIPDGLDLELKNWGRTEIKEKLGSNRD